MAGLQPPLSMDVEIHNPQSLAFAMSLALKIELHEQDATSSPPMRSTPRGQVLAPRLILPVANQALTLLAPPLAKVTDKGCQVKQLSTAEMRSAGSSASASTGMKSSVMGIIRCAGTR